MCRATAVGSPVLALTVDLAVLGIRIAAPRNGFAGMQGSWSMLRQGLDFALHPERPRLDRSALIERKGLHRRAGMGSDVAKRTSKRWYQ